MSELRRYLGSRKNLFGMVGALAGVSLAFADLGVWPLVAVGLYGVGALIGPSDPPPTDERLTDALRADAADLLARTKPRAGDLPYGAFTAVRRIVDVVVLVLDRLDEVSDRPDDRAAAPERLAVAAEIIRTDLPVCLDTYLGRSPSSSAARAAGELVTQLDLVAGAADRLVAAVPDVDAQRAAELTEDLRRRHGFTET